MNETHLVCHRHFPEYQRTGIVNRNVLPVAILEIKENGTTWFLLEQHRLCSVHDTTHVGSLFAVVWPPSVPIGQRIRQDQ